MAIVLVGLCTGCSKTETKTKIGAMPHKGTTGVPKNMQLTAVYLHEYPLTDTKGNKWDKTDGPDVFFVIRKDADTLVRSEVAYNIPYTIFQGAVNDTLPAVWRFTLPLEFKDYAMNKSRYCVCFYDRDDTGDQFMFQEYFDLKSFKEDGVYMGFGEDANGSFLSDIAFTIQSMLY